MSGGHFDYKQYYIDDIADDIEKYLNGQELYHDDVEEYIKDREWLTDKEKAWVREHKKTLPNISQYSEETLALLQEGARKLREAAIYAQRIDWLFSGDDSEESFKKRIREDLLNSQAEHIKNKPNLHHDPKVDIGYAVDRALEYCLIIGGNKEELKDRILSIMCHLHNIKQNLQKL